MEKYFSLMVDFEKFALWGDYLRIITLYISYPLKQIVLMIIKHAVSIAINWLVIFYYYL